MPSQQLKAFPDVLAIIDTETTGMRAEFSRVIDIGIIRIEKGNVVRRYQTLVNPGGELSSFIVRYTGIKDNDLVNAPTFEEIALEVKELLDGAVFVAHNASFDYAFIRSEFSRIGIDFKAPRLCTVRLSRALFPKERRHNLDSIIERFGISCGDRHRAMPDAAAVHDFLKHLDSSMGERSLRETVARLTGEDVAPHVARDTFSDLPDSPGVYFFYGPEQELLYIGKSKHIRTRARSHFHGEALGRRGRMQDETSRVHAMKTSGELSALILEASLIKKESPIYNRMLRHRRQLVIARKARNERGFDTLRLEKNDALCADPDILGVFRAMPQAKERLRELGKKHGLCEKLLGLESGAGACFGYQLGKCDGACIGKSSPEKYNGRLNQAFKARRIRIWPYEGVLLITEQEDQERGTIFLVDNWTLVGAFKYDNDSYEPLVAGGNSFDYDIYKILTRFMRAPANKRLMRVLSQKEFGDLYARCTGSYETVVSI